MHYQLEHRRKIYHVSEYFCKSHNLVQQIISVSKKKRLFIIFYFHSRLCIFNYCFFMSLRWRVTKQFKNKVLKSKRKHRYFSSISNFGRLENQISTASYIVIKFLLCKILHFFNPLMNKNRSQPKGSKKKIISILLVISVKRFALPFHAVQLPVLILL